MLRLAGVSIALLLASVSTAAAQSFFLGDGCDGLPGCEGGTCPGLDDHPFFVGTSCFCAPGAAADTPPPPMCCTAAGATCATGTTCTSFTDRTGGICIPPGVTYCGTATAVSFLDDYVPCHTTPGGFQTPDWRAGDCDGDGVANGEEVADPLRDPCCHNDYDCCIAGGGDPASCCLVSADPFACCSDTEDPVACCLGNAEYSACCLTAHDAGRVSLLECCVSGPAAPPEGCCVFTDGLTGAECCEALEGPVDLCCEVGIFCPGEDGGNTPDAGVPAVDAGTVEPVDAGPAMDAGEPPLSGEDISFGGGGGCVCSAAAPRGPSGLAWLALLGIAIPAVVRRRR